MRIGLKRKLELYPLFRPSTFFAAILLVLVASVQAQTVAEPAPADAQSAPADHPSKAADSLRFERRAAGPEQLAQSTRPTSVPLAALGKNGDSSSSGKGVEPVIRQVPPRDRNRDIYYRHKLELSVQGGYLPVNIPFPFDFLMGGGYNVTGLNYTLVPISVTLRWQSGDVAGPLFLRGNWDFSAGGMITPIPRGPETHFGGYVMGIRRNFVPRNWKIAPYLEGRVGTGGIDAKGPKGVAYAQGQDFVFTLMLGSGFRYNISPRYAFSAGVGYMHISNLYMSEPKYDNYGINVYGPTFGLDVRLGKPRRDSAK